MNKFDKMRIAMRYWLHGKGYHNAVRAMEFASRYHIGIRKDGQTPEFHHQVSIASYLRTLPNIKFQEEVLATSFLHDIIEDYDISVKDIETSFGLTVLRAVQLLSKDKDNYNAQAYYSLISKCPIASIVKGGDRVHNIQTMIDVFSDEKKTQYMDECETFILPMLKDAKRRFPEQEPAYENIKLVLLSQIELIKYSLGAVS